MTERQIFERTVASGELGDEVICAAVRGTGVLGRCMAFDELWPHWLWDPQTSGPTSTHQARVILLSSQVCCKS